MPAAHRTLGWLAGIACFGLAALSDAANTSLPEPFDRLPPSVVSELFERGSIIFEPRGGEDRFRALVIFAPPRSDVMHLLSQQNRQPEYRPELRDVESIGEHEGWSVEEHRMRIAFVQIVYRIRTKADRERWRIDWELDPRYDNDVEQIAGSWELYELEGDRSLGVFGTTIDVGPALPRMLQDAVTRRQLVETLENTRRWVDSDGRFRP